MDSFTHIALGACIGEAFLGKRIGKKALFLGAAIQSLPDIDVISSLWESDAGALLAHRSFTHSFFFVLLFSIVLGFIFKVRFKSVSITLNQWILFFGIQLLIHILLDSLNVYGVGWFEPFSHQRISFNLIFVADPFYSFWLIISFISLMILKRSSPARTRWVIFGIGISAIYLIYCGLNKMTIERDAKSILQKQNIAYTSYFTTPAPLNNWLWYIVAESKDGFYIGYRSLFDNEKKIDFTFIAQNKYLLDSLSDQSDLQKLIRFSRGYYGVEMVEDKLVFNDLRFGKIMGWDEAKTPFVFSYYLEHPDHNKFVLQRGRFRDFSYKAFNSLYLRIRGK